MAGYTFVKSSEIALNSQFVNLNRALGDYVAVASGLKADGQSPLFIYLMKVPNEIYNRRRKQENRINDGIEEAIRHPRPAADSAAYVPESVPIRYNPLKPQLIKNGE